MKKMRKDGISLCIGVVLLLCLVLCSAAKAAVPIEGKLVYWGWTLFPQNPDTEYACYLMEGTSDNVRPLPVRSGVVSPLDDQLVDLYHLVKSDLDGANAVDLAAVAGLTGINCLPRWSPDGSKIAFQHTEPVPGLFPCEVGFKVWVMNADGSNAYPVRTADDLHEGLVCWSPNGYRLQMWVGELGTVLIDIDGTDAEIVSYGGEWSPDGSHFVDSWSLKTVRDGEPGFLRQLVLLKSDGTDPQVLVEQFVKESDIRTHLALHPPYDPAGMPDWADCVRWWIGPLNQRWSPRGDRIAFVASLPFDPLGEDDWLQQNRIWVYSLETGELTQITNDRLYATHLDWTGNNTSPGDPVVTVDNTTVTFDQVIADGLTTIIRDDDPPELPIGYQFAGEYYHITSTAEVAGLITICMTYTDEQLGGMPESDLTILHYNEDSGLWGSMDNVTVDPDMNTVGGQTQSLSIFGLAVLPHFGGFLQPINADGSSLFKWGRTVPVKFWLTDPLGNRITDAAAHLSRWYLGPALLGTVQESATATWADVVGDTFRYDPEAGQYVYNLSTKGMAMGTWQLRVTVEGWPGFQATVLIGLR